MGRFLPFREYGRESETIDCLAYFFQQTQLKETSQFRWNIAGYILCMLPLSKNIARFIFRPEFERFVMAAGEDLTAIGRENGTAHLIRVAFVNIELSCRFQVP